MLFLKLLDYMLFGGSIFIIVICSIFFNNHLINKGMNLSIFLYYLGIMGSMMGIWFCIWWFIFNNKTNKMLKTQKGRNELKHKYNMNYHLKENWEQ